MDVGNSPHARWRQTVVRVNRIFIVGLIGALLLAACGDGGTTVDSSGTDIEPVADPDVNRPPATSSHLDDLVAGLNGAGFELFLANAEGNDEDAVVSPLSIGLAFGMADVGATGDTEAALADFFGLPASGEARWEAFNALDLEVTDVGEPVVRLANRQFPDVRFDTAEGYDETLARYFGVAVEPLPLQDEPEASRQQINDFVAERTEDLIPELLPSGFVNPQTVMVLVNALYLEADWARPFGKYPTEDQPFTRLDGSTVTVPLMHELELRGPAVSTEAYAATELPYEGGELSMLVVVPEQGRFVEVQSRLGDGLVDEIDQAASEGAVELFLPRFESDTNVDLRDLMEGALGVTDVFGVGGFGGIAEGITLERAVHAADIAVDEIGTVAAAATALGFEESGPPEPEVVVRADRPFLYLIRHQPTGAVLFVGRVTDPSA